MSYRYIVIDKETAQEVARRGGMRESEAHTEGGQEVSRIKKESHILRAYIVRVEKE